MVQSLTALVFSSSSHERDGGSVGRVPRERQVVSMPTTPQLIVRIRSGDAGAFEILFRNMYQRLVRMAALYADGETAADAVADVFVNIWATRDRWNPDNAEAYLYRAVRNRVLDLLRGASREMHRRDAYHQLLPDTIELAAFPESDPRETAVRLAIAELNPRQRELVMLRWQDGRSAAEVAELLGTTVRAVTSLQDRTLEKLRKRAPAILAAL